MIRLPRTRSCVQRPIRSNRNFASSSYSAKSLNTLASNLLALPSVCNDLHRLVTNLPYYYVPDRERGIVTGASGSLGPLRWVVSKKCPPHMFRAGFVGRSVNGAYFFGRDSGGTSPFAR
jgi:hypothetical protein